MEHTSLHFLIVEKDPFIARDMSDGLAIAAPGCSVEVLKSPEELPFGAGRPAFPLARRRTVLITKLTVAEIDAIGLAVIAAQINALIVLRQGEDPLEVILARGWFCLPAPFTGDDLAELIAAVNQQIAC